jgi:hypothetical protein
MNEQIALINAYYDGIIQGLWRHAFWKDGIQYVGNMNTKYTDAIAKVQEERKHALFEAYV